MLLELLKLKEQGFIILCLGDMNSRVGQIPGLEENTPDVNKNGPMFLNFITQASLVILNTLPLAKGLFTRFMSSGQTGTQSLLDYGMVDSDHVNTVSSFVIDAEARYGCGTDHALLVAKLVFGEANRVIWNLSESLKFNFNEKTDFTGYQYQLDKECSNIPLHIFEELPLETQLTHITHSVTESGKKTLGLKTKVKKKPRKLPQPLLAKIRKKNAIAKQVENPQANNLGSTSTLQAKLSILKLEIKDSFAKMKLQRRFRFRANLLKKDPSRKNSGGS